AEAMLARYGDLPGRCGLRVLQSEHEALEAIIAQAAETRARQKSKKQGISGPSRLRTAVKPNMSIMQWRRWPIFNIRMMNWSLRK
ncbi:MAG: hypothetical protein ACWGOX_16380, partial [Desulforhopalus sp.]